MISITIEFVFISYLMSDRVKKWGPELMVHHTQKPYSSGYKR